MSLEGYIIKVLYLLGGFGVVASGACNGHGQPVNTQEAEKEVTKPAIVEGVPHDLLTQTQEFVITPTIESTLFPKPTDTPIPTSTPFPTQTHSLSPIATPTTSPAQSQQQPYQVVILNEDMASILFSTEMEIYKQGTHPVAAGIKAILQELGITSNLKELVTFVPKETLDATVKGSIDGLGNISVSYPTKKIHPLYVSMQEEGSLPSLSMAQHEFIHLVQGHTNPELFNLIGFKDFFSDRSLRFKEFTDNTNTLAIAIAPLEVKGSRAATSYGTQSIYFDEAFSEEDAGGILKEFGKKFGFKDYTLPELEREFMDAYKRFKTYQDEGSPIIEAVAYAAEYSVAFNTLDELVEKGIQSSVRDTGSDVSLGNIWYVTELIGQIYGLLERKGFTGTKLDLEIARISGQLHTPTDNQLPIERLESYLENLRGDEEPPSGREVLEKIMERKKNEINQHVDSVRDAWTRMLLKQYPPNLGGSYEIEVTAVGDTYIIAFKGLQ